MNIVQFSTILAATEETNLNDALVMLQDAIGQEDGGIASVFFSGKEETEDSTGNTIEWAEAMPDYRELILVRYLQSELRYINMELSEVHPFRIADMPEHFQQEFANLMPL